MLYSSAAPVQDMFPLTHVASPASPLAGGWISTLARRPGFPEQVWRQHSSWAGSKAASDASILIQWYPVALLQMAI